MNSHTVVFIRWWDSHLKFGTFDDKEMAQIHPLIMSSAGILWSRNDEEIVIIRDVHESDGEFYYRDVEAISMKYVISIQEWKLEV